MTHDEAIAFIAEMEDHAEVAPEIDLTIENWDAQFGENGIVPTPIGDVKMGRDCSIWFSTVLRGDVNTITIGDRVNIQDGSVLHTLYQKSVIEIGNDVSVGHNVTIHGAKVCDYALIGMGSVLLDGVEVGEGAIVAAGSVVSPGTKI